MLGECTLEPFSNFSRTHTLVLFGSVSALTTHRRYHSAIISMRHLFTTFFLTLFSAGIGYCQTQAEMNTETAEDYMMADAELNKVYQQIIKEYSDDQTFLDALRTSQHN